jgi:MFS family permease
VEALGLGWRALYAFGLVPLVLLAWWRRALPETERFERHRAARESEFALAPIVHLARDYPGRFAVVSSAILIGSIGGAAADFLAPKYLQQEHGWAPGEIAVLYIGGGALGIFGAALAGRWSDRLGRKPVAVTLGLAVSLLSLVFYNMGGGWLLPPLWIVMIFALMGSDTVSAAFGAELFPTSHRSTAAGARAVVGTIGAAIGLALESALYAALGSHWSAVSVLLALTLLSPLIVAFGFPETAGRSLEEISPERAP